MAIDIKHGGRPDGPPGARGPCLLRSSTIGTVDAHTGREQQETGVAASRRRRRRTQRSSSAQAGAVAPRGNGAHAAGTHAVSAPQCAEPPPAGGTRWA